jgi:hypothetical protein
MTSLWTSLGRLYRLGLCGTLVAIDALLLLVFFTDLRKFIRDGYKVASLQTPPTGSELIRALFHAGETGMFILLLLPLLVASVRIIATRLKLPSINWPAGRILTIHSLVTLLIAVGIVACVRMEVASGLSFAFDSEHTKYVYDSYVYRSDLDYLPVTLNNVITHWLPDYILSWKFASLLVGLVFSYFTGRKLLENQRNFLCEYIAASKLADCDPNYLPASSSRHVSSVRSCAPPTGAIQGAVERELHALNFGHDGVSYDHNRLAKRVREKVASYLFADTHGKTKVRILPDTLSCIYAAISNEEPNIPVILSSVNQPAINDPVTAWFGRNRKVQILGIDETRRLETWAVQQDVFLQALAKHVPSQSNAIVVLPLVSLWTGQIFGVRSLIQQIRIWSTNALVILDGSFLNVTAGPNLSDLYGADYLCLNVSQWITCSESCGVLVSRKWLTFDPDWERQIGCVPANIRTLIAFSASLRHSLRPSARFNDPKSRSDILIGKFCDVIDPRLLSIVEIQDLPERTYFLTVEPAKGKTWQPQFADKIGKMGLSSSLWQSGTTTRLTLAFPPYVDFWQTKSVAVALTQSVV